MEVFYEKKFLKDLKKIRERKTLKQIQVKIEEIESFVKAHEDNDKPPDIPAMIKLQGYDHYYRIRIGDYRLGISVEITNSEVPDLFRFVRCLHRKDIYTYFP